MKEQIVVTLTSWTGRIANVPTVLDSIFAQTVQPDAIVLNLAEEEFYGRKIPDEVQEYIDAHDKIQINWRRHNTKVYKKFLPTLLLYPDALILPIDDDFIYPPTMIEEFMKVHKKHPNSPISGNHYYRNGIKCHCGCASLVQAKHFEGWQQYANKNDFRDRCTSSDLFYTYLAAKNGYLYEETETDFQYQMQSYNSVEEYYTYNKGRLGISARVCYKYLGVMYKHFENKGKPYCVLGAAQTEEGKKIERAMIEWLSPCYDLYVVEHDGRDFEYPAIKFAKEIMTEKNAPCLYLHTKGAYYKHGCTLRVRRMWRYEFCENQDAYFKAVDVDHAAVATPYTGECKVTWFNGWVANPQAFKEMHFEKTRNRFFYEYNMFTDVDVIGIRMNDIEEDYQHKTMHEDLKTYFNS